MEVGEVGSGNRKHTYIFVWPNIEISFSSIDELKPQEVLLSHQTPDSVCLFEYHENVRLIIKDIPWLPSTTTELVEILVYNELDKKTVCSMINARIVKN